MQNDQNKNEEPGNVTGSNKIKDPENWTTGNEPMTASQRSYLETLSGNAVNANMTKAEAAQMIDDYKKNDGNVSAGGNAIKDPDDWTTGDEEMTDAQRSYIKTLSDEAGEQATENLTKAAASKKIDELQHKTGRGE